jgi:hypothetical protein
MAQHAGTKQLGLNFTVKNEYDHKEESLLAIHPVPSLCGVPLKYIS